LHDVLVIGDGPAGSQVAYRLAGQGYDVAVLGKKEPGSQVCCTGIISQVCANAFAIDEGTILGRVRSARIFAPSGKLIELWRRENQACIINRSAFDVSMANRAQSNGAQYMPSSPAKSLTVEGDRVVVELTRGEANLKIEARAAVVATGFGTRLVEGLGKIGDFVIGAQAEVETRDIDEVEVYLGQEIAPGFFAWLVPTSPPMARVGLLARRNPEFYIRKLLSSLHAQGKVVSDEESPSYRGVPLQPLARTYGERVLVVGDAAGQVKPTTGGGIYYGLMCADIAAHNLGRALEKDNLSAKSLASYEREWKRKLGRELRIGYWGRRFFEHLNDKQIDRIFDIIKANGIDDTLLKADDLPFDSHGKAILRLVGQRALSRALRVMKVPFRIGTQFS
tara:strand:- start:4206 stop:5384 length:1179 start_codon:yes stop_codon:yes gene_type:complete